MKNYNKHIISTTTPDDGILMIVLDRNLTKRHPAGVGGILSRSIRKTSVVKTICFPMNKGLVISDEPIDF